MNGVTHTSPGPGPGLWDGITDDVITDLGLKEVASHR